MLFLIACEQCFRRKIIFFVCMLFFSFCLQVQLTAQNLAKKDALFQTIRSGDADALNKLLGAAADPNDSLHDYSALMAAALNGSADEMKILIDHGATVNYQNRNGLTALWLAAPDISKIKLLLDNGADAGHLIGGYGILAKLAGIPGTLPVIQMLVSKGADMKKSAPDNTLVYNAAATGDTALLGFFLSHGLLANDTTAFGDYPICNALTFCQFATLKMLVENGANVNTQPSTLISFPALVGLTPLMIAALNRVKEPFFYLLDHGADPNLKNKKGYTAMMLLEQSEAPDDFEMTKALIDHGAVVNEKAPDGTDARYYAGRKGKTQTVALLEKYANQ